MYNQTATFVTSTPNSTSCTTGSTTTTSSNPSTATNTLSSTNQQQSNTATTNLVQLTPVNAAQIVTNSSPSNGTTTILTAVEPNERDNLRILQTLNVQIQSMALKLDQILTQTEEVK
jgi:hypothetical protein